LFAPKPVQPEQKETSTLFKPAAGGTFGGIKLDTPAGNLFGSKPA
jgi:hypothetical protein